MNGLPYWCLRVLGQDGDLLDETEGLFSVTVSLHNFYLYGTTCSNLNQFVFVWSLVERNFGLE